MQLAWFNVFFKLVSTLISLPLINILIFISTKIIKGENDKNKKKQWKKAFNHINKRFLKVPVIAEQQIKKEISNQKTVQTIEKTSFRKEAKFSPKIQIFNQRALNKS